MNESSLADHTSSPRSLSPAARIALALLLVLYAAGLLHGVSRPWTGLHDWNGAFYSQLARNMVRYPLSVGHGMPVVAIGDSVPPPSERSIYATHPPGLVWLLAAATAVLGDSEWVARSVAIAASLGTLALLFRLIARTRGEISALAAGLVYAVLPMTVFFGRMVDQEPLCLFFMMLSLVALQETLASCSRCRCWRGVLLVAIVCCIWTDWPGVLFAALMCAYLLIGWMRRRVVGSLAIIVLIWSGAAMAALVAYLVYAGLDGQWQDLAAIFFSRREGFAVDDPSLPLQYATDNLTWPVLRMWLLSLALERARWPRSRGSPDASGLSLPSVMWIVNVTGLVWVVLFWRQFIIHNYWMYYLGPWAACGAGNVAVVFWMWMQGRTGRAGRAALCVAGCAILLACLLGADRFASLLKFPPDEVRFWTHIHDSTRADERILLIRDPVKIETFGGYRFRNLVTAQQTYYLDRCFDVAHGESEVRARLAGHRFLVLPTEWAEEYASVLADISKQYRIENRGGYLSVDLTPKSAVR